MKSNKSILAITLISSLLVFSATSCKVSRHITNTLHPSSTTQWYNDTTALLALYQKAVDDASKPTQSEVIGTLVSITNAADNPDQEWIRVGDTDMVLVASLMKEQYANMYLNYTDTFRLSANESWFTVPSEWLKKRGTFAEMDSVESHMRMVQMLGLPITATHTKVVELYVDAKALFRPSRDPEITDHTSQLSYPEGVSEKHHDWFEYNASMSYVPGNAYPWTQLGYTYDWHDADGSHVGLSEFVALKGALAKVKVIKNYWDFLKEVEGKQ